MSSATPPPRRPTLSVAPASQNPVGLPPDRTAGGAQPDRTAGGALPDRTAGGALPADERPDSFYAAVGGHETFERLVTTFYEGVADDPVLRPLYPEEDLSGARERLTLFLEQYWGGPTAYSEQRGHPRLRMRHAPFPVGPLARDRWLAHMRKAVRSLDLSPVHEATLWDYLERAAYSMVNTWDDR